MTLDELDLSDVPERAVAAARRAAQPWTEAWVVDQDGETGVLLHTGTGLSWFFASRTWTAAWHTLEDVVSVGPGQVSIRRSGGESYRFGFRDGEETIGFLSLADTHRDAQPPPSRTTASPSETRSTLTMMIIGGMLGTCIAVAMAMVGEDVAASIFAVILIAVSQVALLIGLIGWGVVLGLQASRE